MYQQQTPFSLSDPQPLTPKELKVKLIYTVPTYKVCKVKQPVSLYVETFTANVQINSAYKVGVWPF